ncbi:MAG TPA: AAA family ATPase, partial [Acidimicrobiia bacterium]
GRRIEVVDSQLRDESAEIARINAEVREVDESVSARHEAYRKATDRRAGDQAGWEEAEESLKTAQLEVAASGARVEAIEAALAGRFDPAARDRVEGADGSRGSLVSLLDVPSGLEKAVDAALGRWADAVAFVGVTQLRQAVEQVKTQGGGGIPVVAAAGPIAAPAFEVAASSGVESLVGALGPAADRALASRLLGDVLLVEGWTTAWALIARNPALRAVTPEGDLISVDGVQIAHPDGAGPAMLEAAEVAAERARTALARAVSIHTAAKRDFEKSRESERQSLEELESVEIGLAGKTEAMGRLQKSVDALEQERSRLREREKSLRESMEERERRVGDLSSRLMALEGEEGERLRVWEDLEARRIRLAADREIARSEWQQAATAVHGLVERRRLLEDRKGRIEAELVRGHDGDPSGVDAQRLDVVSDMARRAVDVLETRLAVLRERQADLRAVSQETVAEVTAARSEFEMRRSAVTSSRDRVAELAVRLTELRLMRESVIESIRREADAAPEAALSAPRPDYGESADLRAVLEEKSAQLRRLGPVNPLAAAEFAELDERHTFIADQLADVESSRSELRKVIKALEEEIERRFQEAFIEVAEAYQRYFGLLFPGGRGRIRLADPGDPEAGLLIEAQPLGKKVSQLTLLSGGERSLAALAFLFAIFEARPSPFYVLDEVEAALDDANLRRFLRIVDEFRQRAQLLIVTHQQQTMEAADVLYGVTMEPGGSSQVVRKDMSAVAMDLTA